MAQLFFVCRKRNNHAALREWQKYESELSLKVTFMRLYDTKKLKKVHFPISGVAETQQKCGLDDDSIDNLFYSGKQKKNKLSDNKVVK